jgi:hypothetical protein
LFLQKKNLGAVVVSFLLFWAVFEGVLGKVGVLAWCFDGEIVVVRWWNVVFWMRAFGGAENTPTFRDFSEENL